jgi:primary-amine oxidase
MRWAIVIAGLAAAALPFYAALGQNGTATRVVEKPAIVSGPASVAVSAPAGDAFLHPLDPLNADEVRVAVETVRAERKLASSVRFMTVTLQEPAKELVVHPRADRPVAREAFMVLLDNATGKAFEVVVNLKTRKVTRFDELPAGVQPSITLDEFVDAEQAARKCPEFQAAMKKRGITDLSGVMVEAWSAGHYGNEPESDKGKRLVRALCWLRTGPVDNGYARPIEDLITVIDLNKKEVVRVEDLATVPLPPRDGNWGRTSIAHPRSDLKPLEVSQSEGPSFVVKGNEVHWQKWAFRVGFNPREGLVVNTVSYDGRPIMYRGSIAEMVVPYGDPKESVYRKNAFDVGEYGLGIMAASLALGCDCLGTIKYFDGQMADSRGRVVTIKNAICLHEEDNGLLWKHSDWRTNLAETRRSRRLALSMVAVVGNYDYAFYWYFYQDGTIQLEVKLTGIMSTQTLKPGETSGYGTEVAPRLLAPYHQHFFGARLDLDIDGPKNTAQEVNVVSVADSSENPHGNAFRAEVTALTKESAAQRTTNAGTARFWRVVNEGQKNLVGGSVAYRLCPGEASPSFALPSAAVMARAGFLKKNLWVTPYRDQERFPAGNYPNQSTGGDGLPKWTREDRDIASKDLVVWYVFGHTHVPRVEDWPVMPVSSLGFMLRPDGFFEQNPALDVPAK